MHESEHVQRGLARVAGSLELAQLCFGRVVMGRVKTMPCSSHKPRGGGSHLRSHHRLQSEGKACWILAHAQL